MKLDRVETDAATKEAAGGKLVVIEREESGEARLTLNLKCEGVLFQYSHNKSFVFSNKKRADGILFFQEESGWKVLIIELKRTVKAKEWSKVKEQWHGAWHHALALSGVLEAAFTRPPRFLLAYRKAGISEDSADPVLLKEPEAALAFIEWNNGLAEIEEIGAIAFEKVPLDENGVSDIVVP